MRREWHAQATDSKTGPSWSCVDAVAGYASDGHLEADVLESFGDAQAGLVVHFGDVGSGGAVVAGDCFAALPAEQLEDGEAGLVPCRCR
jgi:hypothetical protein